MPMSEISFEAPSRAVLPICVMASMSLEDILGACGVDPSISTELVASGWNSDNFACVAPHEEGLEAVWGELVSHEELNLLQKSALRAAFKRCRCTAEPASSSGSMTSIPASLDVVTSSSWSESFAPKLDQSKITQLKEKFSACYPSELINHDTMPSTRLLSLVHHQLQRKQWTWIQWKHRLTMSKADEPLAASSQILERLIQRCDSIKHKHKHQHAVIEHLTMDIVPVPRQKVLFRFLTT